MSKSKLIAYEQTGVLRRLTALNRLDTNEGIITTRKNATYRAQRSGLLSYSRRAYDDTFGKGMAASILDGNGVSVTSVSRDSGQATLSIHVSAPFEEANITVKFPHKAY